MLRIRFPAGARGGGGQQPTATDFPPARVLHVELSQPIPAIDDVDPSTGRRYGHAFLLARLHGRPLGVTTIELPAGGLTPRQHAQALWSVVREQAQAHLLEDGLPVFAELDERGLPLATTPWCIEERRALLRRAPFATVVVATRDRPESLAICLEHLLALEYPAFEILVVDNAPASDATARLVERVAASAPNVRYAREDRPGLAPARNLGIELARGEIVAITDDDVIVDRLWLAELVAGYQRSEDVACVTGSILPMELETPTQALIEQYWGLGKGYARRVFDLTLHRVSSPLYPFAAGIFGSGANLSFRRSVLRELGGFDPCLGAGTRAKGGEELAIFFQILQRGHRLVYEPAAIINHRHRDDYPGLKRQTYGYGVGLTAYLTKIVLDQPSLALELARRAPRGVCFALSPDSAKNRNKSEAYPAELTRLELLGMAAGPFGYLASRWEGRRAPSRTPDRADRDADRAYDLDHAASVPAPDGGSVAESVTTSTGEAALL